MIKYIFKIKIRKLNMTNLVISGVYVLYFENSNNKYYIGKSYNIYDRYTQHCRDLRCNAHHSNPLQNAYNKYKEYPTLDVLKTDTTKTIDEWEIYYIKEFDSFKNGYNQTGGGEGAGYGHTAPSAVLEEDDYLAIFFMLVNTKYNKVEIAEELNVPIHIVNDISLCNSHTYLKDMYPIEYDIMQKKYGNNKTKLVHAEDTYVSIFKDLVNTNMKLKDIANKYGVKDGIVEDISRGATHKYLESMFPDEYPKLLTKKINRRSMSNNRDKPYPSVVSPDGIVYNIDSNAKAFAISMGLHQGHFAELLNGKAKSHKGWKLVSIS